MRIFVAAALICGCAAPLYEVKDFGAVSLTYGARLSPKGDEVLYGKRGRLWVHRISEAHPRHLKVRTRVTMWPKLWLPSGEILAQGVPHKAERSHVFRISREGKVVDLTPGDHTSAYLVAANDQGREVFVSINDRDRKRYDILKITPDDRQRIFVNSGDARPGRGRSVDRKGRYAVLEQINSKNHTSLLIVDLVKSSSVAIDSTEGRPPAIRKVLGFRRDGRLYYLSTEGSNYLQVWSYEPAKQLHKKVLSAPNDIRSFQLQDGGKLQLWAENEPRGLKWNIKVRASGRSIPLPKLPGRVIRGVRAFPGGDRFLVLAGGFRYPNDLYIWTPKTGVVVQLTHSLERTSIDPAALVEPEFVHYPSFDGRQIPAWLFRPKVQGLGGKSPAVIWLHGGPSSRFSRGFNRLVQLVVNRGYAVLAPDYRGSKGYGLAYEALNDGQHGIGDVKDCLFGQKFLAGLPWIAPRKTVVYGQSYGGFLSLSTVIDAPQDFRGAISLAGAVRWHSTLVGASERHGALGKLIQSEYGDIRRLEKIDPTSRAAQIRSPVLLMHGRQDPRVFERDSARLYGFLRDRGRPVKYVVLEGMSHSIRSSRNLRTIAQEILGFLERNLGLVLP